MMSHRAFKPSYESEEERDREERKRESTGKGDMNKKWGDRWDYI